MLGWLGRWRPKTSLEQVGTGAHVRIESEVLSPAATECSLAPTPGAAIRWVLLYEELVRSGGRGGRPTSELRPFASGWRSTGPLVVRSASGRTLSVPLGHAQLEALGDPADGVPLGSTPASGATYGALAARAPAGVGMVFVREHVITHGQRLVVRAFVEPAAVRATGFRDAAVGAIETDYAAVRDVVLEDLL